MKVRGFYAVIDKELSDFTKEADISQTIPEDMEMGEWWDLFLEWKKVRSKKIPLDSHGGASR